MILSIHKNKYIKHFILGSQHKYKCFYKVCDQFTGNLTDFEFYDHKSGDCKICQDLCDQDRMCRMCCRSCCRMWLGSLSRLEKWKMQ